MSMYDCDNCFSAGSVNQWGLCEICGEEFEDTESLVKWRMSSVAGIHRENPLMLEAPKENLVSVGRDAA